jgi:hypothetical protein
MHAAFCGVSFATGYSISTVRGGRCPYAARQARGGAPPPQRAQGITPLPWRRRQRSIFEGAPSGRVLAGQLPIDCPHRRGQGRRSGWTPRVEALLKAAESLAPRSFRRQIRRRVS